jgi:glucan endo-1,3-alpha-glucosidase
MYPKFFRRNILILTLSLTVMLPLKAEIRTPIVVAHWIVPMAYKSGQNLHDILIDDIRAALELGIDGFAINVFNGKQANDLFFAFINAADTIGANNFKLFLSADMSLGFSSSDIVNVVSKYEKNSHYLRINGKPLLSTFGGDKLGNDWWQKQVLERLKATGQAVTFVPHFDRSNPNGDNPDYGNWLKVLSKYPSVDGLFNFLTPKSTPFYDGDANAGFRNWSSLVAGENLAKALHDSKKIYMAQYMPYYWAVCHPARQYVEYQGGRGMHNTWTSIIKKQNPEIVQLVTWNDYSESTYIQPTRIPETKHRGIRSMPHLGYYELLKYYVSWYRTNCKPKISKDSIFYFYRTQVNNIEPVSDRTACSLGPISSSQKWGEIKDVIYVTTALTAPADIVLKIGEAESRYKVPAGLSTTDIPFVAGIPILTLLRDGNKLLTTFGRQIEANPEVQNFNLSSNYAIAGGQTGNDWLPSDKWKTVGNTDWFEKNQTCSADRD